MRTFLIILAISVSIIFINSCKKSKPNDPSRFYLKKYELSIKKPVNWQVVENFQNDIPLLFVSQPEDSTDNFTENIYVTVTSNVKENTIRDYYKSSLNELKLKTNMFSVVSEGDNENAKETNRWLIYNYTSENQTFTVLAYIYLVDDKGIVIHCTGTPESFDKYKPVFEGIASSLQEE